MSRSLPSPPTRPVQDAVHPVAAFDQPEHVLEDLGDSGPRTCTTLCRPNDETLPGANDISFQHWSLPGVDREQMNVVFHTLIQYPVMQLTDFLDLASTSKLFGPIFYSLAGTLPPPGMEFHDHADVVDDLFVARSLLLLAIIGTRGKVEATTITNCRSVFELLQSHAEEIGSDENWSLVFVVWAQLTFHSDAKDARGLSSWAKRIRKLGVDTASLRFEQFSTYFDASHLHEFLGIVDVLSYDLCVEIHQLLEQPDFNPVRSIRQILDDVVSLRLESEPLIPETVEVQLLILRAWFSTREYHRGRPLHRDDPQDERFLCEQLLTKAFAWLHLVQASSDAVRDLCRSREKIILQLLKYDLDRSMTKEAKISRDRYIEQSKSFYPLAKRFRDAFFRYHGEQGGLTGGSGLVYEDGMGFRFYDGA